MSVSKEDGVVFKAICITKPEVEVNDYKGIEVTKTVNAVTDDAVNAEIEKLQQKGVRIISVEKPCCHNIYEGQKLVEAAKKYDVIVQDGAEQRSNPCAISMADSYNFI